MSSSPMGSDLDSWRHQASFDVHKMRVFLAGGEEQLEIKDSMWSSLERESIFHKASRPLSLAEARETAHNRWKKLVQMNLAGDMFSDYDRSYALVEILETLDQGVGGRYMLHKNVFMAAIRSMGTERHNEIFDKGTRSEIVGCFCLTELTHGSNSQAIQTTATWEKGEFILHSPHKGAMKVWAGNLALSATHALVFAQLHVGGKNEGVHAFVVQIRDLNTHNVLPGITIGDMGEKPGQMMALENGWMLFDHHRVPLSALLNKGCDVTADGVYVHEFSSKREQKSVSLGALSIGRIGIVGTGTMACVLAATIAIRYSAVRKQFGPAPGEEVPVLSYPLQRRRVLPMLASAICLTLFHHKLREHFVVYMVRVMGGEKSEELVQLSKEVHALSSSAKPRATWLGVHSLNEARPACGGHGFLYTSRLNELRDTFDPSQTFEGENNILIQQASNYLLAQDREGITSSPMGSIDFMEREAPKYRGWEGTVVKNVEKAYAWLLRHLLEKTKQKVKEQNGRGADSFTARNEIQIDSAHPLALAYAEYTMIRWASEAVGEVEDVACRRVLEMVVELFALHLLHPHLALLYIGGFCDGDGGEFGNRIKQEQVMVEESLGAECVSLVDAIAPPDFALASVLGSSDGRAYDRMVDQFESHAGERAPFADDLVVFLHGNKAKL